jgi:hypothetical protein
MENNQLVLNVDNYLTFEEKKNIIKELFTEKVAELLSKESNISRIISNISHDIVFNEVQRFIPNYEEQIKLNVQNILRENKLNYYVFKKKDAWDNDESLAIKYLNETVIANKDVFQSRIKECIENYDLSSDISENVSNHFSQMAESLSNLSELFYKKSK